MVSHPDGLRQSQNEAFPELPHTNQAPTPDFSNESFNPASRQASPANKEKDLPGWTSRTSSEESYDKN